MSLLKAEPAMAGFKRQPGQILVIFMLVLIGLLSFAALAIDGGLILLDRRASQNGADGASLAGAGSAAQYLDQNHITWTSFHCADPIMTSVFDSAYTAALTQAANSGYHGLLNNLSTQNGVEVTCVEDAPHYEKYIDVRTMITTSVVTSFARILIPGDIQNTVASTARIHPRTELGFGSGVTALSGGCGGSGGLNFNGTGSVQIDGEAYSNSCIDALGAVTVSAAGGMDYLNGLSLDPLSSFSPYPVNGTAPMPVQSVPAPDCGGGAAAASLGGGTIGPGIYSAIQLSSGSLILQPGLYCLIGDVDIQGGSVSGSGVTFYLERNGLADTAFTISTSATVDLSAPVLGSRAGLLIQMEPGNRGAVTLRGSGPSTYSGTVFAPDGNLTLESSAGASPAFRIYAAAGKVILNAGDTLGIHPAGVQPYMRSPTLDLRD